MVRAKFRCMSVTNHFADSGNPPLRDFRFLAVIPPKGVHDPADENVTFWKYTPQGEITLSTFNPDVDFEPGKAYYLDFIPAPG